ncbi:MAG TPA: cytosine permease [Actinomycetota bacterium]|nr:cytosine permease [Actinomycetota bacterium]
MTTTAERVAPSDPGISPVPESRRVLNAFDLAVLWGDLGIGLLVLVTGALLVPALGLGVALIAIVVGSVLGVGLLALVGAAGARHGVPTMVLFRPVLGVRGSWIASALNVVQLVGWVAVEFWAMSYVAALVSERVFGVAARPLWLIVVATLCIALALWGPVGVTKVWLERFSAWVILAISVVVTVLVFRDGLPHVAASGGFPNFGQALDLVIAMPISWLPLVADYTRFARGSKSAFSGTFVGYLIANIWLYALGALLVLDAGATPDPRGIALGILAIAGGSLAGILFLVGLLAGESDEAFANLYSTAVSIQNVWPGATVRRLVIIIGAVGAVLAAGLTMTTYEAFLFFIGSVFVPLFGILAADHFVVRRGALDTAGLYRDGGRYWFSGGFRLSALVPWIAGFLVFHLVDPSPLGWLIDLVSKVIGAPLGERIAWLPGAIPSFIVAFLVTLGSSRIDTRPAVEARP